MRPQRGRGRSTATSFLVMALIAMIPVRAISSPSTGSGVQFYFINGVSVAAYMSRKQSARALQTRLQQTDDYPTTLPVIALPNPSQGLFSDIFQKLVLQKQLELAGDFKAAVMQTVQTVDGDPTLTPSTSDETTFSQALAVLNENVAAATEYTSTVAPTVQAMSSQVIAAMQAGHPVVIVGHSEGTMYANEIASVVRGFVPTSFNIAALPVFADWLKVVDLATPASSAPDDDYATARQDIVITDLASALSAIGGFGSPLAANQDFPNAHQFDLLGHGLTAVYLNPQVDTANAVPALIVSAAGALPAGPAPILAGDLSGLPASGRFAVQRPDGSIAYPQGEFVADTSDIETGTYRFGAIIGNPNDCFAGAWSAQIAYLTDTLPSGSGATTGGGGFGQPACGSGAFQPLMPVTVTQDATTGGFVVAAQ